ncbi:MAG: ABC transporter permease [Lachnospiraceae bacterium]|nr:ABC transporter permease [Lachnospiraceae bacterium]MBQ9610205.1 ABC transporter permease [Lachnospiraceae bacterium]
MSTIIKSTLKLTLRNKGFWFFLIITPLLSVLILNINQDNNLAYYSKDDAPNISELSNLDDKVAYYRGGGEYVIKVYDACQSELSEYLLNKLAENNMFKVCRVKADGLTKEEADICVENDGINDRMGAAIYLDESFDKKAINNEDDALTVYILSDDEREKLLIYEVGQCLGRIKAAATMVGATTMEADTSTGEEENIMKALKEMDAALPKEEASLPKDESDNGLSAHQISQKTLMGYAFAFMTLGFVFCGIIVAHTAIKEQKDMVLTRIKLSGIGSYEYFAAKLIVSIIVSMMLTAILGICSFLVDTDAMGMNRLEFIGMIFLLGIIFCSISLLLGSLMGNVMSANVAAFTLWSLSSMLAGLYFPLDYTTKAIKTLSYIMPQKWFVDGTEMILTDDNKAFFMLLCVTVAYLVIIISLGSVGIKFKSSED